MFGRKKKNSGGAGGGQFQVLRDAFALTKRENPTALLYMAIAFVATEVLGVIGGSALHHPLYFAFLALPLAFLVAFFLFTRLANKAAYSSIEDQVGAGASVLMGIRKGWSTDAAVNVNRNQDMVHRSTGRGGVVLVGEGGSAVHGLLSDEKKKVERFLPGVPVTTLIVGDLDGQVSLRKLQKAVTKLPKQLNNTQVREVRARLKAVGGLSMPIPQGPVPGRMGKGGSKSALKGMKGK